MMHDFARHQGALKPFRHQVAMFQNIPVLVGHRLSFSDTDLDVAGVVETSAALPVLAVGSGIMRAVIAFVTAPVTEFLDRC